MFQQYVHNLLKQTIYYPDEDGVIIAEIPWKQGYFTQWETYEEAREMMKDLIETLLFDEIKEGKYSLIQDLSYSEVEYA